jgi:hypothetical protein
MMYHFRDTSLDLAEKVFINSSEKSAQPIAGSR